jgi:Rieske Fe-S protein
VTQEQETDSLATRRGVLAGVGLVGLAGVLTACGAGGSSSAPAETSAASTAAAQDTSAAASSAAATSAAATSAAASTKAATHPATTAPPTTAPATHPATTAPATHPATTAPATHPASSGPPAFTTTSAIPVGGGTIFSGARVVITQPSAGDFHAFSAVCTHMGCIVSQVSNGTIDCPCHGSQYNIATGAVVAGPAPMALPAESIRVSGGNIFLG